MSSVIKIENLWKEYRLGVIGHGTLTHDLQSWWARVRGKEDPNSAILPLPAGQEKQIEGDRFWALRDLNFEVKEGEILGIIGKNGAGKSTLLKILSRVTAPTKGNIKVKGRIASLLEVGTGFHQELTGRENIFMNGAILGMSKQEIRRKLDEIIDFSGVEEFIDTPVKRYSSGMYVRLAFAVAAHLDPEILIIDEVLAVGDAEFQKKCLGKMNEVAQAGRTVLFVSHNLVAIQKLCPKAVLLANGQIEAHGVSNDIVCRYLSNGKEKTGEAVAVSQASNDVNFKGVSLRNSEGVIQSVFDVSEEVFVHIEFEVNKKGIGYNISCEVQSAKDGSLFTSALYDYSPKKNLKHSWSTGAYYAKMRLPAEIMKNGEYWIDCSATIPKVKVFNKIEGLMFDLTDLHGPTVISGEGRQGYIHPILKWDIMPQS